MVQDALMESDAVSETLDEMEEISRNEKKFEKRRLRPLASFLDFDVSRRPTQAQDRVSKKRVFFGIFLGIFWFNSIYPFLFLTVKNAQIKFSIYEKDMPMEFFNPCRRNSLFCGDGRKCAGC